MQGTGKSYEVSGETTEWEDILIKKGITSKESVLLGKGLNPEDFEDKPKVEEEEKDESDLYGKLEKHITTLDELDELEDDGEFSDNHVLNEYRQKRLQQLQQQRVLNRFGDVTEIIKDEWLAQVTEGSKAAWVVVHLYQDSVVECRLLEETMLQIASQFKYIKFLKIKSTQAIENWPDRNLPSLFLYHDGELKTQLLTLNEVRGKSMKPADLEWWLVQKGVITTSELTEDPRTALAENNSSSSSSSGGIGKMTNAAKFAQERRNYENDSDED